MNRLKSVIKQFEDLINVVEKNEIYQSIISEIPENIIGLFPVNSRMKYKSIYADMRLNGNTKEKAMETAGRMTLRAVRKSNSLTPLFLEMQKALLNIHSKLTKGEFYQDSEDAENAIDREEIPVIGPTPDGTGPHGRGAGPGQGKSDGTGMKQ